MYQEKQDSLIYKKFYKLLPVTNTKKKFNDIADKAPINGNLLSYKEKKELVIKLYLEGYNRRDIAKIVHLNFGHISKVIKEYGGEDISEPRKEKSNTSKAYQLFLRNKSLVEVAIHLDLPAPEVEKMHDDFVRLRYQHLIPQHYHEIKMHFPQFIEYYKIINKNSRKEGNKVISIIDNDYIISKQESRIRHLDLENQKGMEFKVKLEADIQKMEEQYKFYSSQNYHGERWL